MFPYLALSVIRWGSRVKWSNPRNGIAPSPVVAKEKGAIVLPSTKVANFTYKPLILTHLNGFKFCKQLNGFKYCYVTLTIQFNISRLHTVKWVNSYVWFLDGTLIGITTLGWSGPGSNSNKGVLHSLESSRTVASPSDTF